MLRPGTSRWTTLATLALALVALLALSGSATAAVACKRVSGKLALQLVTGPACTSPVGFCAAGSYSGDVKGDATFTGSTLTPTVDTPTTAVLLLTGDNLIQTARGDLLTKDAIVLRTTGEGEFAEVDVVVGGTSEYAGATGTITATGTFTAQGAFGSYSGQICRP